MIALFLRRDGWPVTYLGQNVPVERIVDTVRKIHPGLLLLSASTLLHAAGARRRQSPRGTAVRRAPASDVRWPDSTRCPPCARTSPARLPTEAPPPASWSRGSPAPCVPGAQRGSADLRRRAAALRTLRHHEDQIVAEVVQEAQRGQAGRRQAQLSIATRNLLIALESALRFDQPDALADLARWAGHTMPGHGVSQAQLHDHVQIFSQVALALLPRAEADTVRRYLSPLPAAMSADALGWP
jgi:hypothetical protein